MSLSNQKFFNFEFFDDGWSDLSALGGIAEAYAYSEPHKQTGYLVHRY